jgi:hypothetical protein
MHKMKEEVTQRILAPESPKLELWLQRYGLWKLLWAKWSFQEGSGVFLKFWEWLEGLRAKDRALAKCGKFLGFLGEFLGYLEWLGPNRKYFSEMKGPTVIFPNDQGPQQNFQEAQGPKCKMVRNYGFLRFIFQRIIRWTGSTALGLGGAALVHRGPWRCGQKGAVMPCRRAVRGR